MNNWYLVGVVVFLLLGFTFPWTSKVLPEKYQLTFFDEKDALGYVLLVLVFSFGWTLFAAVGFVIAICYTIYRWTRLAVRHYYKDFFTRRRK